MTNYLITTIGFLNERKNPQKRQNEKKERERKKEK